MIGILGGMGPIATVDFMKKIILATAATKDQEHIPLLACSNSHIPDRSACILHGGETPFPLLKETLWNLVNGGASCIAIPCNTAHYWYNDLALESPVPILNMILEVIKELENISCKSVSVLATEGTIKAGIYDEALSGVGIHNIAVPDFLQRETMAAIYQIKRGYLAEGEHRLLQVIAALRDFGPQRVIIGCTEISLILQQVEKPSLSYCIDAADVLVRACIRWWLKE